MIQKKAAICFSWQARTLDKCYEYIKWNILDQIWEQWKDYDIFCCTEDDKDSQKVIELLQPIDIKKIKSSDVEKIIEEKYWDVIKRNYKDFIYPWTPRFNLKTFLQQFYKNKVVNDLKNDYSSQNNINYKYVIRVRFDILPLDKINLNNIDPNLLNTPFDSLKSNIEINDMFAIWNQKNMDIYYSIFDNFEEIIKLFKITPNIFQKIIFSIEKIYVFLYWAIIKILTTIKTPKSIVELLFKIFSTLQWSILWTYKRNNCVFQEKLLYKLLSKNKITLNKIKCNLFLVRENRFLNIFISKD